MRNGSNSKQHRETNNNTAKLTESEDTYPAKKSEKNVPLLYSGRKNNLPEILIITSYPPRVCGIATYSQDLYKAVNNKFSNYYSVRICALESDENSLEYTDEVKYVLKTSIPESYEKTASLINNDREVSLVVIQHEFGFFSKQENAFKGFMISLKKPLITSFHTVLHPIDENQISRIRTIADASESVIVMTNNSAEILINDYNLPPEKVSVIPHGTHLVLHLNKEFLKRKYGLSGRKILTTFGLLSSGKSIETTLYALPSIIKRNPDVLFLIMGKTHPEVMKEEGEAYRNRLEDIVTSNNLGSNVKFINSYLSLPSLLEYLQLTDIYLFTTKDPNQAVSGTFAYAMSCGCPIISTPIPHAKELLTDETGIIIDFFSSDQLASSVILLLNDTQLRHKIRRNTLQKIIATAWENSSVKHTFLFRKVLRENTPVQYNLPAIDLRHIREMTTDTGILQFSRINQPDLCSGYTLDDNARALVVMCMHYVLTNDLNDIELIDKYLKFIDLCLFSDGQFLNYVTSDKNFSPQNETVSLDDANGRAVWALGFVISQNQSLPDRISTKAVKLYNKASVHIKHIHSTRAMAFAIKGLWYAAKSTKGTGNTALIKLLACQLAEKFEHESSNRWLWFEDSLTYANSILPEAMLYSWLRTKDPLYKSIALASFDFLLSIIFNKNGIEVISNRNWLKKGQVPGRFGEQPIDVSYTIMTLGKFYDAFGDINYLRKMEIAFNWFLGNNRLHQVVYNPCTGGCHDGLEEYYVNLNQGAESTLSYLMARLTIEKYRVKQNIGIKKMTSWEKKLLQL